MTVRIVVPVALRDCAGGAREVAVEGATVRDALDDVGRRLPILERRLRDERGLLRPHVMVFVDGVLLRTADDLDTPVHDGTELYIAPAVAGG